MDLDFKNVVLWELKGNKSRREKSGEEAFAEPQSRRSTRPGPGFV